MIMTPRLRVEKELENLKIKSAKLLLFTKNDKFNDLSKEMQTLLLKQYNIQLSYIEILEQRLKIWTD